MAKPDNRSDNVSRIADTIQDTMSNMREAEDYLKAHGDQMRPKDRTALKAKDQRRDRAIEGLREEIKDEANFQQDR